MRTSHMTAGNIFFNVATMDENENPNWLARYARTHRHAPRRIPSNAIDAAASAAPAAHETDDDEDDEEDEEDDVPLAALAVQIHEDSEEEEEETATLEIANTTNQGCPICQCDFIDDQIVTVWNCGGSHTMHAKCSNRLNNVTNNSECPLCRNPTDVGIICVARNYYTGNVADPVIID